MTLDYSVILFIGGILITIIQWFLKQWINELKTQHQQLQEVQKNIDSEVKVIKETYVPKTDLKDIKDEILNRLSRIENIMLGKSNV